MQAVIREIRATHDATALLCTHDLAEADLLAERVGILDRGELVALAPARDLEARYGVGSLEAAFFAATGHELEDETGEGVAA